MSAESDIEWTDATWNPTRGCSAISPGCANCYAERVAGRFSGPGRPFDGFIRVGKLGDRRWSGNVDLVHRHLHDPLSWRDPRKVFVNSMSDLFHEGLDREDIAAVFGVMARAHRHTFQFLTKRADRMLDWYEWIANHQPYADHDHVAMNDPKSRWPIHTIAGEGYRALEEMGQHVWSDELVWMPQRQGDLQWPLPNVWAGVSVENRKHGVPRIAKLRQMPAAVRFISFEPLLEDLGVLELAGIHWAIIGCESGPGARACETEWVRDIIAQCHAQGVKVFLKQLKRDDRTDAYGEPFVHAIADALYRDENDPRAPRVKGGGVIARPILDGKQHLEFPC